MALKKWKFGTKLSTQITEQNANIDEIDTKITELSTQITEQNANIDEIDTKIKDISYAPLLSLKYSGDKYDATEVYGAVIENWDKVPPGISIAHTSVGTQGAALIHKYENDENYGSFISFGWGEIGWGKSGGRIRRFRINNGVWEEQEG